MGKYNTNAILEQIRILCNIRYGKGKVKETIIKSGLKYSVIDNLRNGSMPSADKLAVIADALDCSTDYLLSRASFPAMPDDLFDQIDLTAYECELLEYFRKLNEDEQAQILSNLRNNQQIYSLHQEINAGRDNYGSNVANYPQYSNDDMRLLQLIHQLDLVERSKLICELSDRVNVEKQQKNNRSFESGDERIL